MPGKQPLVRRCLECPHWDWLGGKCALFSPESGVEHSPTDAACIYGRKLVQRAQRYRSGSTAWYIGDGTPRQVNVVGMTSTGKRVLITDGGERRYVSPVKLRPMEGGGR